MSNKTIYLKDYQKPNFMVENIFLSFDLHDDHALVTSELRLVRQAPGSLELMGDELELVSVSLNEKPLNVGEYDLKANDLIIMDCPDEFLLTIVTKIYPQNNTQLSGLYRSNHMFCTQCEAEGFRRITFYPDRPDVLSRFTTRIEADKKKYPVLLSNGNPIEQGEAEGGRHWVIWQDPYKKPSYLFALVAGDLACIEDEFTTSSGRKVDLRIYVEPGNEDKCSHAMTSLKRSMRWDEEVYGREYDLDIFMIVAVSDFNMGAMENKGLNIFNSKYILAKPDTATDLDYANIEGVVAHEYFHNWTGNRITCRDWFQLSLKEGLTVFRDQEFSRDMNSRDVNRIMDVKTLMASQFPEDAGSMAHPVRPDSYQEINNFYTATIYNKGAEVIRMQHTLLGPVGFRKGMDLYFDRHDGQAVTINDFVSAMQDANGVDFSQLKHWYDQAGTPEINVETQYKDNQLTIHMKQYCRPTPGQSEKKPFHIPVRMALFTKEGHPIAQEKEVLELKEQEQSFVFNNISQEPVISLLRDFSAPVKLHYSMNQSDKLALLRFETNGYSKWQAAQSLAIETIHQWMEKASSHHNISEDILQAYQHILSDTSIDELLRAELLSPPGYQEVIDGLNQVDVTLIESLRDEYRKQLGNYLYTELAEAYHRLWQAEDHSMSSEGYGRRKLRNVCLWLMMKSDETNIIDYCQQQFAEAKTMSDQMAAFNLMINSSDVGIKNSAIKTFYQQWQNDELVMDKWFTAQAICESSDTIDNVRGLLAHPDFNIKNPNRARSLIGGFCMANPRNFHEKNGKGYEFLTKRLLELDKVNPQVAARMATPFTRWSHLNQNRQHIINQQLLLLSKENLSKDLAELVEKSMKN